MEGNHYFPPEALKKKFLKVSDTHTVCPWKSKASYFTLEVNDKMNEDAAWYYPEPKEAAKKIKIM